MRLTSLTLLTILALSSPAAVASSNGAELPSGLVVDIRIFEARRISPDIRTMDELSFFIDTDGSEVSEEQWLATIASKVPNAFLAVLALETTPASDGQAGFELAKRSRTLAIRVNLTEFLERGTFKAPLTVQLERGGDVERELDTSVELRLDQTYVFSDRDLELSASEYLSHLRDYEDMEHRGELYERLRDSTVFLIIAVTPRIETVQGSSPAVRTTLTLPEDVELPELESPYDIPLVGSILLHFDVDDDGAPQDVSIARSSITEVNPRILGEVSEWRFPEAAGQKARLQLELRAEPGRGP